jgi:hypothetical protein
MMTEIIKAGIYFNWLVCPIGQPLAPGYEWASQLPAGTQEIVKVIGVDGKPVECVYTATGKPPTPST